METVDDSGEDRCLSPGSATAAGPSQSQERGPQRQTAEVHVLPHTTACVNLDKWLRIYLSQQPPVEGGDAETTFQVGY